MIKTFWLYFFLLITLDSFCSKTDFLHSTSVEDSIPHIIQKFINYTEERRMLSLEYLKLHYGIEQSSPVIYPVMIVLHYTAGGSFKSNYQYFTPAKLRSDRKYLKQKSELNVGAHYLIDRDGTIYNLFPDTLFVRHVIGLNYCAIGIENIGSETQPLTNKQVEANAALIKYLATKYPIKYLIGHSEYGKYRNTLLWKEKDKNYFTIKIDPGQKFLTEVREKIKNMNLQFVP